MRLSPKESGKLISNLAKHVTIRSAGVESLGDKLCEEIKAGRISTANFSQNGYHPKMGDPAALDWIFVVDTLNFCFWHPENAVGWKVDGASGYFALCAAINRAMKENIDILNPAFYSRITEEQLANVLRSDTAVNVPLLNERMNCLHEVGASLLEHFKGSFENCVKQANNSATQLLSIIIKYFKCFQDEAVYKQYEVSFYKRGQILVGDVWAYCRNSGIGKFDDINEITMFADYRVPQSLLYFGVICYSNELLEQLKTNSVLEYGSIFEVEIRGCSIHAVEETKEYLKKKSDLEINSVLIDHFLWDFRRNHAQEILEMGLPFHKSISIFY